MAKKRKNSSGKGPSDATPDHEVQDSLDEVEPESSLADRYGPDGDLTQDPDAAEEAINQFDDLDEHKLDDTELAEAGAQDADAYLDDDTDREPAEGQDGAVVVPPAKVKSGRGLAFFSLLLALASLGGAGYLYYELIHLNPLQKVSAEMDSAIASVQQSVSQTAKDDNALNDTRIDELRAALTSLERKQGAAMSNLVEEQQARLQSTEKGLIESLNKVANEAPPTEQEWRVAEVEYLLRIANHRVLMESDPTGALQLLSTADNILAEMDDFGMHDVRAQLSDEILSLKRVRSADLQGLFLRLEALKRELGELPLQIPEFVAPTAEDAASEGTNFLQSLKARFDTYVQVRDLETQVKPLLSPDETMYLELNLRLMLERAQLAALRKEQEVYEQSLASAQDWLQDYLDPESAEVTMLVEEIDSLLDVQLKQDLPDVSGSLRTLLSTERGTS